MAECLTPYMVENKKTQANGYTPVPCGKCPNCLKRRISGWSYRLMMEDKRSISSLFLTLTYDTATVPITERGFLDLRKRDLQLFFKRLRKAHPKGHTPIRYYAVGEYGGESNRPHYHLILFNASIELVQDAWGHGHVHYGLVTGASVGYTLKYMSKPQRIPMHHNDDRTPEFSLMSKGLGDNHVGQFMRLFIGEEIYHNGEWCIELKKKPYWSVLPHYTNGIIKTVMIACISRLLMAGLFRCPGSIRIRSIPTINVSALLTSRFKKPMNTVKNTNKN